MKVYDITREENNRDKYRFTSLFFFSLGLFDRELSGAQQTINQKYLSMFCQLHCNTQYIHWMFAHL